VWHVVRGIGSIASAFGDMGSRSLLAWGCSTSSSSCSRPKMNRPAHSESGYFDVRVGETTDSPALLAAVRPTAVLALGGSEGYP
jgi:hypothetical protein